jgi:Kef-type K+ transport system membrane component KefB
MVTFQSSAVFAGLAGIPFLSIFAYLDPGSGSFLLQLLLAGLLGLAFFVRAFWGRIVRFFRKTGPKPDEKPADKPAEDETPDEF